MLCVTVAYVWTAGLKQFICISDDSSMGHSESAVLQRQTCSRTHQTVYSSGNISFRMSEHHSHLWKIFNMTKNPLFKRAFVTTQHKLRPAHDTLLFYPPLTIRLGDSCYKLYQAVHGSPTNKYFDTLLSIKTVISLHLDYIQKNNVKHWVFHNGYIPDNIQGDTSPDLHSELVPIVPSHPTTFSVEHLQINIKMQVLTRMPFTSSCIRPNMPYNISQ